jgi:hypothetical protein
MRRGARSVLQELRNDSVHAAHRADIPGEGEQIAPVALGVEQLAQRSAVAAAERGLEPGKPAVDEGG